MPLKKELIMFNRMPTKHDRPSDQGSLAMALFCFAAAAAIGFFWWFALLE